MELGDSRLATGPHETANVERDGKMSVDLENGQVNTNGCIGVNAALENVNMT